MRLWTLHPKYLDRVGLVALWREALLAQAVLMGKTRGYRNHPQLIRFRSNPNPLEAIAAYLSGILDEAQKRGYRFDRAKAGVFADVPAIFVTRGQLLYERDHLQRKLCARDSDAWRVLAETERPAPHPLFKVRDGGVEPWERRSGSDLTRR